jgi:hypothetical protein
MYRCYEDKLPEAYKLPFVNFLKSGERIFKLDKSEQVFIIEYILQKLSTIFGNRNYYASSLEEHQHVLEIWTMGLKDMTFKKILDGLYAIMKGFTAYIDFPPKSYIGFRKVCMDNNFNASVREEKKELLIENRNGSEEVARENIKRIREMMSGIIEDARLDEISPRIRNRFRESNVVSINDRVKEVSVA